MIPTLRQTPGESVRQPADSSEFGRIPRSTQQLVNDGFDVNHGGVEEVEGG